MNDPKIIVALDFASPKDALSIVGELDSTQCRLKVGKEMFTREGPAFVELLISKGFDVFLDLKFHDIPQTVAKAVQAAADLGVWMVNVHAFGGRQMLIAAKEVLAKYQKPPLLIGVTILTSLNNTDLVEIGMNESTTDAVIRLTKLVNQCDLDGIVCSAQEVPHLKSIVDVGFKFVTPGVRLDTQTNNDDQKRIVTPKEAIAAGSHYLVIGRPITKSSNPKAVLSAIEKEISHIF